MYGIKYRSCLLGFEGWQVSQGQTLNNHAYNLNSQGQTLNLCFWKVSYIYFQNLKVVFLKFELPIFIHANIFKCFQWWHLILTHFSYSKFKIHFIMLAELVISSHHPLLITNYIILWQRYAPEDTIKILKFIQMLVYKSIHSW